ncbi:hypothetical protein O7626_14580 [Micromonospora sp. WMMD1102]|uniref:hypothetical protein n=1 Tax=Micromonospora sp. WMMD1102 TaxID=3016105 RepID=UPI0024150BFC|nr:hypothetical protein [Micromonospora sp. WMMD1102]MDG4787141.1 hypothetical protein [Micromonospora sp. WMMD1102]
MKENPSSKATIAKATNGMQTAPAKATAPTKRATTATSGKQAAPTRAGASTADAVTLTPPASGDYLLLAPGVGATKSILFRVDTATVKVDGTVNVTGKQFLIKHRSLSHRRREVALVKPDDFQVVIAAGEPVDGEALVIAARPERFGPGGTEARKGSGAKADATTTGTTLAGKSYVLARFGATVAVIVDGQRREEPFGDEHQARRGYINLLGTLESDLAVV